jgi:chemotaxis protein histidine kinase CheA
LTVTDVRRGVGVGALLAAAQELGGTLSINSTLHEGTSLRFSFPPSALRAPNSLRPMTVAN